MQTVISGSTRTADRLVAAGLSTSDLCVFGCNCKEDPHHFWTQCKFANEKLPAFAHIQVEQPIPVFAEPEGVLTARSRRHLVSYDKLQEWLSSTSQNNTCTIQCCLQSKLKGDFSRRIVYLESELNKSDPFFIHGNDQSELYAILNVTRMIILSRDTDFVLVVGTSVLKTSLDLAVKGKYNKLTKGYALLVQRIHQAILHKDFMVTVTVQKLDEQNTIPITRCQYAEQELFVKRLNEVKWQIIKQVHLLDVRHDFLRLQTSEVITDQPPTNPPIPLPGHEQREYLRTYIARSNNVCSTPVVQTPAPAWWGKPHFGLTFPVATGWIPLLFKYFNGSTWRAGEQQPIVAVMLDFFFYAKRSDWGGSNPSVETALKTFLVAFRQILPRIFGTDLDPKSLLARPNSALQSFGIPKQTHKI